MKKIHIISILLSCLMFSCSLRNDESNNPPQDKIIKKTQNKESFEIKKLRQILTESRSDFDKYSLVEEGVLENYFKGFTSTDNKDSLNLRKIVITENIRFNTYEYIPTDYSSYHDEFFEINNKIFKIDSIVKHNNVNLKYYNPYLYLREYAVFSNTTNGDQIIGISAQNRVLYRNADISAFFIIKIHEDIVDVDLLYDLPY